MSNNNVVGINSKQEPEVALDTITPVLDSTGHAMIVGNKYEMYAPAAKQIAKQGLGLTWADSEGFSFIYDGVIALCEHSYVASRDVSYDPNVVPADVYESYLFVSKTYGSTPLCPVAAAGYVVRPATDE